MIPAQGGLVVERIDMRKAAGQEDHDQVLSFCRMMGRQRRKEARSLERGRSHEQPGRAAAAAAPPAADFKNDAASGRSCLTALPFVHDRLNRYREIHWPSA